VLLFKVGMMLLYKISAVENCWKLFLSALENKLTVPGNDIFATVP